MKDLLTNPGFIALMGTLFGGAGLKIVENWLNKAKNRAAEEAAAREEFKDEIEALKLEIIRINTLLDEWKTKYYEVREQKTRVETDLRITLERLETLRTRLDRPSEK
jgi:chromosome segregation ATPase